MNHRRILRIIRVIRYSIHGAEHIYTHGSCYQFYLILKSIVPEAEAYYDSNHVITKINNRYYDVTGEVPLLTHLPMEEYYPEVNLKRVRMKTDFFLPSTIRKMKKQEKNNQID